MDIQSILIANGASSSSGMDRKGVLEATPERDDGFENLLKEKESVVVEEAPLEKPQSKVATVTKDKGLSDDAQDEPVIDDFAAVPEAMLLVQVPVSPLPQEVSAPSETVITDDHAVESSLLMKPQIAQGVPQEDEEITPDASIKNEMMDISSRDDRLNTINNIEPRDLVDDQVQAPSQPLTPTKMISETLKEMSEDHDAVDDIDGDTGLQEIDGDQQVIIGETSLFKEAMSPHQEPSFAFQEKPVPLKEMVDGLWIHQNLNLENPRLEMQKVAIAPLDLPQRIDSSSFMDQLRPLIDQVKASQTGGEMTINLKPAELGSMRVEIQVDKSDVRVALFAEKSETREVLQRQWSDLKNQVSALGLKLEEMNVKEMPSASSQRDRDALPQHRPSHDQAGQRRQKEQDDFDDTWNHEERMIA